MLASPYTFECITPCFCSGANQTRAEIRASSIRAALRWWFRALGGPNDLETEVFGGTDPVTASSILLRVSNVVSRPVGRLPQPHGVDPLSYILYFPSVSSDKSRWTEAACYGPGTIFRLDVRQLRRINPKAEQMLDEAIIAFRHFGSIGMHVTRGLGAVQCSKVSAESLSAAIKLIEGAGFTYRQSNRSHKIWDAALKEAGQWLQNDMRKEFGAGGVKKPPAASALGSTPVSENLLRRNRWTQVPRQTSAVYLRPIKQNGHLVLAAFEAPHQRVLGEASRIKHSAPILKSRDFTQGPPQPPQHGGRSQYR